MRLLRERFNAFLSLLHSCSNVRSLNLLHLGYCSPILSTRMTMARFSPFPSCLVPSGIPSSTILEQAALPRSVVPLFNGHQFGGREQQWANHDRNGEKGTDRESERGRKGKRTGKGWARLSVRGNKRMEHCTAREEGKPKKGIRRLPPSLPLDLFACPLYRASDPTLPQFRRVVCMIRVPLNVTNAGNTGNMNQRG